MNIPALKVLIVEEDFDLILDDYLQNLDNEYKDTWYKTERQMSKKMIDNFLTYIKNNGQYEYY